MPQLHLPAPDSVAYTKVQASIQLTIKTRTIIQSKAVRVTMGRAEVGIGAGGGGFNSRRASRDDDQLLRLRNWRTPSDVMMPGETGAEIAAHMRRPWPGLAVIFISGYSDLEVPADGGVAASEVFVQKPFTAEQLLSRVDAQLRTVQQLSPISVRSR